MITLAGMPKEYDGNDCGMNNFTTTLILTNFAVGRNTISANPINFR
jgi:hypothetical protein